MGPEGIESSARLANQPASEIVQPRVVIAAETSEFQNKLSQALAKLGILVIAQLNGSSEIIPAVLKYSPQVLILDFFLKPHDALYMIEHLMRENPIPILLFLPPNYPTASEVFQEASRIGASGLYPKPTTDLSLGWLLPELGEAIFRLAKSSKETLIAQYLKKREGSNKSMTQNALPSQKALGIVGSTGAMEMLKDILLKLPNNFNAATLVSQHMSAPVWDGFRDFLSKGLGKPVSMAKGGEILREGHVILSPVHKTLMFQRSYVGKIAILENARKFKPGQVPLQPNFPTCAEPLKFDSLSTRSPCIMGVLSTIIKMCS